MSFKRFSHVNSSGNEMGAVTIEHLWADVYGLRIIKKAHSLDTKSGLALFEHALTYATELKASSVQYRLFKDPDSDSIAHVLPGLGFTKKSNRVEYKADVSTLPNESGSPFSWTDVRRLGWSPEQIAGYLKQVATGALDSEPYDDPFTYIQDWLYDPVLTHGLDCIGVGELGGIPCALVVTQVNPKTGWSRISYLGLTPEFRGKGLGKWVHRHGFEMMETQGRLLYHGGTFSENSPMVRLFEKHGCRLFCEMEEWVCSLDRRPS